jgi:GNAT superfamily N-acetyltransferase
VSRDATDAVPASVQLSPLEAERFGIRSARAASVTLETLPEIMHFCRANAVIFLIARCRVEELATVHAMERAGFRLMDTLLYWACNLVKGPIPADDCAVPIRPMRAGEANSVRSIAVEIFRGYFGHYHADPRLDPQQCDAAYVSWAERSCLSKDVAEEVLVAELDGRLVGFITLRRNSAEEGEAVVGGVLPEAQGLGIYRAFQVRSMQWCEARGCTRILGSTQVTNTAVQKVLARLGYEPSYAYYTLHKWFDEGQG